MNNSVENTEFEAHFKKFLEMDKEIDKQLGSNFRLFLDSKEFRKAFWSKFPIFLTCLNVGLLAACIIKPTPSSLLIGLIPIVLLGYLLKLRVDIARDSLKLDIIMRARKLKELRDEENTHND